jgi:hypothetical protein
MMSFGRTVVAATLVLTGCAGDPAVVGDRASPKFQADLKACRESGAAQADKENAKHFPDWLASPFTGPGQRRRAVRACMVGKGYAAVTPR